MGRITEWLLGIEPATSSAAPDMTAALGVPVPQIASPFNPGANLNAVVWADLIGAELVILTRAQAMAVPAVARQRHLIAGTIARLPLQAWAGDTLLGPLDQPTWMYRTDGPTSPFHRMLWTVDDLIFYGWSLWEATRGAANALLAASRVAWERWEVDTIGRLVVDGVLVQDPNRYVLIPGPHEGILQFGSGAIRRAADNSDAASKAARNPAATVELHYTGDEPLKQEQIDQLVTSWSAARRGENGGVAYTSKYVEAKEHGTHEASLLIEGRNADAVDMSRLVSSPASMADATNAGASLTYETSEGRNGEFIDYGLALYMGAIEARLSQDDALPRGQRATFDTSTIRNVAPADPVGPNRQD